MVPKGNGLSPIKLYDSFLTWSHAHGKLKMFLSPLPQNVCAPNFQCWRDSQLPTFEAKLLITRSCAKWKIQMKIQILFYKILGTFLLNLQPESYPTVAYRRATNRKRVFLQY